MCAEYDRQDIKRRATNVSDQLYQCVTRVTIAFVVPFIHPMYPPGVEGFEIKAVGYGVLFDIRARK